jgi:rRNA processing protein Gar1
MIFIKKNRTKYPVINTPISKLYLVHLQEKYPKGFYLNDGTLITSNTNVSRYDVKIDFINSAKILGLIVSMYYVFTLKKRVKKKVNETLYNTEERLKKMREELSKKKRVVINEDPSFYSNEEE